MSSQGRQLGPAEDTTIRARAAGLPCSEDDGRTIAWVLRQPPALLVAEDSTPYGEQQPVDVRRYTQVEPIFRRLLAAVTAQGGTVVDLLTKMVHLFGDPIAPYLRHFHTVLQGEVSHGSPEDPPSPPSFDVSETRGTEPAGEPGGGEQSALEGVSPDDGAGDGAAGNARRDADGDGGTSTPPRVPHASCHGQLELDFDAPYKAQVKEWLLTLLRGNVQPGASELLVKAETECGWQARYMLLSVIQELRDDPTVQGSLRPYLKDTLTDDAVQQAVQGEAKANDAYQSTLDDLFRRSALYRDSHQFREAIEFTARFRHYAPYNNMLVKVQKPSCCFYATARDWKARFERDVKEDARPLLILAPMHPVMLVYDLDDTEGKALPEQIRNFAQAEGEWNPRVLDYTLHNAARDQILVQGKELGSLYGGFATTRLRDHTYKMRIGIHSGLDDQSGYAVLCHELAHIYLGHLGSDRDNWWPSRTHLTHDTVEIEAEAVAFIVCTRWGLTTSSAAYVALHLKEGGVPASVSLELIVKVAGKLEEMGKRRFPLRKARVGRAERS